VSDVTHTPVVEQPEPLWTRTFMLVWLNQFLGYSSNWLVLPVLPLFLASQGYGESYIGLVLAAFSITSFSARPFFGHWADRGKARGALAASSVCLSIAAIGYISPNTAILFISRGIHGLGWAGINAVGSGWVAMLAPARRRAEAVAYYTSAQASTVVFGPVLGLAIAAQFGTTAAFLVASAVGVAGVIAILCARQVAPAPRQASADEPEWWALLIERSAVPATILLGLVNIVGPAASSYVPLYYLHLGLEHPEIYFFAQGITGIVGRAMVSRLADRVGRVPLMGLGFVVQLAGFFMMALGNTAPLLIAAGSIITLGNAIREPSFYAWVIDRAAPHRRGAALATYTMGFQIGSGIGSAMWGNVIQFVGYQAMYLGCAVPLVLGLALLLRMPAAVKPTVNVTTPENTPHSENRPNTESKTGW
jgi:MFS family permease